jgi:hypothetical protein
MSRRPADVAKGAVEASGELDALQDFALLFESVG